MSSRCPPRPLPPQTFVFPWNSLHVALHTDHHFKSIFCEFALSSTSIATSNPYFPCGKHTFCEMRPRCPKNLPRRLPEASGRPARHPQTPKDDPRTPPAHPRTPLAHLRTPAPDPLEESLFPLEEPYSETLLGKKRGSPRGKGTDKKDKSTFSSYFLGIVSQNLDFRGPET